MQKTFELDESHRNKRLDSFQLDRSISSYQHEKLDSALRQSIFEKRSDSHAEEGVPYIDTILNEFSERELQNTVFVVTGPVFELLFVDNEYGRLWLARKRGYPLRLQTMLLRTMIFARMRPPNKTQLIELLQKYPIQ